MAQKKQNIMISGRNANDRVARAIPKFERQGMSRSQAIAVAIRMESIGRLVDNPATGRLNVLKKNTPWGVPMTAPRGSAAIMTMALSNNPIKKKTIQRNNTDITGETFDALQRKTRRQSRKLTAKKARRRTKK